MATSPDGAPVPVTYWHDEIEVVYEVPASSGGEVYLDEVAQVLEKALTENYHVLAAPPPTGYGLYNPRWRLGAVGVHAAHLSGHLLYHTTVTISATVPVAGILEGNPPPRPVRFVLVPVLVPELTVSDSVS